MTCEGSILPFGIAIAIIMIVGHFFIEGLQSLVKAIRHQRRDR